MQLNQEMSSCILRSRVSSLIPTGTRKLTCRRFSTAGLSSNSAKESVVSLIHWRKWRRRLNNCESLALTELPTMLLPLRFCWRHVGENPISEVPIPAKVIVLYLDLRRLAEEQVKGFTEPTSDKLLPDLLPQEQHVFTLFLDLNETIILGDWKEKVVRCRFVHSLIMMPIFGVWKSVNEGGAPSRVVDFLQHLAKFYEIVVYSDQLTE